MLNVLHVQTTLIAHCTSDKPVKLEVHWLNGSRDICVTNRELLLNNKRFRHFLWLNREHMSASTCVRGLNHEWLLLSADNDCVSQLEWCKKSSSIVCPRSTDNMYPHWGWNINDHRGVSGFKSREVCSSSWMDRNPLLIESKEDTKTSLY